ncbi:hypothetical protein JCGZ_09181 [Jatropha curcas]|uniref:Uncharacterized protein n=1 Tax=Jatropha curcas TaxID=180498 RepID=A0A067KIQ8_JATCU|nr:hypothetical protein JCGZ_09181 [Jatropha curcas]
MSLEDPHLSTALKFQVQITGGEQIAETISATLHHQIIFRLQDHAINLQIPGLSHGDALFIFADGGRTPIIVQTPRQLPREDLEKLIPSVWITNYEQLHQISQPPVKRKYEKAPIHSFSHTGYDIYTAKADGHFLWDVDPHTCDPDCTCHYDNADWIEHATVSITPIAPTPFKRRRNCCKTDSLKSHHDDDDDDDSPWIGLPKPKPMDPSDFRPLEIVRDQQSRVTTSPYVKQTTMLSSGKLAPLSPSEEVLNWQTSNAVVQNLYLKNIDGKLNQALTKTNQLDSRVSSFQQEVQQMHSSLVYSISKLDKDLHFILATNPTSPLFYEKEKEIQKLQQQLREIERDLYSPSPPTIHPMTFPFTLPSLPFTSSMVPVKQYSMVFDLVPRQPPKITKETSSMPSTSTSQTSQAPPKEPKDKGPTFSQFVAQRVFDSSSDSEDTFSISTSCSQDYMDISHILMNTPASPQEPTVDELDDYMTTPLEDNSLPPRPASGPWFTLDDVPPSKWRNKILEFNAWLDLQMVDPRADLKTVLTEFTSRFTGSIQEWFSSLSEYSKKQFVTIDTVDKALALIHTQFL